MSEDEDARQTGAYGLGVLAQFGGEDILTPVVISKAVPMLLRLIVSSDGGGNGQTSAVEPSCVRDNAISSILRLCRYRSNVFDAGRLLEVALGWLPLREDLREAHSCHAHVVGWIASGDPALFGANGERLPKLIALLASLMGKQL